MLKQEINSNTDEIEIDEINNLETVKTHENNYKSKLPNEVSTHNATTTATVAFQLSRLMLKKASLTQQAALQEQDLPKRILMLKSLSDIYWLAAFYFKIIVLTSPSQNVPADTESNYLKHYRLIEENRAQSQALLDKTLLDNDRALAEYYESTGTANPSSTTNDPFSLPPTYRF